MGGRQGGWETQAFLVFFSFSLKMWLLAQFQTLNRWQLQFSQNFLKKGKPLEFISALLFHINKKCFYITLVLENISNFIQTTVLPLTLYGCQNTIPSFFAFDS